jgi:hypothetical protein
MFFSNHFSIFYMHVPLCIFPVGVQGADQGKCVMLRSFGPKLPQLPSVPAPPSSDSTRLCASWPWCERHTMRRWIHRNAYGILNTVNCWLHRQFTTYAECICKRSMRACRDVAHVYICIFIILCDNLYVSSLDMIELICVYWASYVDQLGICFVIGATGYRQNDRSVLGFIARCSW